MQIQFKQVEIVQALKNYIENKGINLLGKTVAISFVAGRKEGGLTAEINIDDVTIPGTEFGDSVDKTPSPLKLVGPAIASIATPETDKATAEPVAVAGEAKSFDEAVAPVAEKAPVNSLFGS